MLRIVSSWVQTIVSLLLFLAFVQLLLPEHRLRDYTRLVLGLVVIGVVLTPLLGLLDPHTWDVGLRQALSAVNDGRGRWDPPVAGRGSADPTPWIARGVTLARRAEEAMGQRVRSVWTGQVRAVAALVAGVEAVDVDARWDPDGELEELRLTVWPGGEGTAADAWAESPGGSNGRDALARRVKAVVSDYFHLPAERVHVTVEGWGMAP